MNQKLINIAQQFSSDEPIKSVQPFGSGNINSTFLVSHSNPAAPPFILQCVNTQVFHRPDLVMKNMRRVCQHIKETIQSDQWDSSRKWLIPEIFCANDGTDHYIDDQGKFWRAMSFIGSARTYDSISSPIQARELGWAVGTFHSLISDLQTETLADTLPGFHITPNYLDDFQRAVEQSTKTPSAECTFCKNFIEDRSAMAHILENAKKTKKLFDRPIHGDPKISNVMIDKKSSLAVSIIDLDTVKPGLIHYDIGDCLRSGCNHLGEEPESVEQISFEIDLCKEILEGYLSQAKKFFTQHDFNYLYDAVRIISFELGLRYFTDFLNDNIYFKVNSQDQNLRRAMVQFHLTKSIESQEQNIKRLISSLA